MDDLNKIYTKQGVSLHGLSIAMRPVLIIANNYLTSIKKPTIVTSTTEGNHSPASFHPYGYAIDFRTRHLSTKERVAFQAFLNDELKQISKQFQVIIHTTHLHVELDTTLPWGNRYYEEQ